MTMATVAIRSAEARDASLILELIHGLAEYERLADAVVATEASVRESLFGPHPAAEVLLAEVDGTPAGFALYFHNYSTFLAQHGLYLEDLFVRPEFRGHGIGTRLLARLAAIAVERRCGRFEWAVLDWNSDAIRFYQALGAEPMSEWTTFRITGEALTALARRSPG